ncbi:mitoferrin-2-like [Limulus polyphemus]|uniref:Mitoferrin-2-like n=1 Tax=Limulus polyphemus TaxID=6850 RepID=A0ABM1BMH0_LIMPO|nr:mitoferrin-2-like [Limulus polyphemus]
MEFDDYEILPSNNAAIHMMAGAAAGIMEHCIIYPLDSVKTRMQSLQPNPKATYHSLTDGLCKMVRYEGVFRPVRGMTAVVCGAGPAHALYFSCYEKMKRVFSGTETGAHSPISQGAAGCLATLVHDAVMTPTDVIKQRMQMFSSPYRNTVDCMRRIWQREGVWAFYRSYSTQLTMNIPFQSIHFMTYEFMQDVTNEKRTYNPKAHVVSGAVAGAFAAAITTPLDVCKTLLNTQERETLHVIKKSHVNGLFNAAMTVYKFKGLKGYFQGLQARVVSQVPSTAVAWSVYEFFKYVLQSKHALTDQTVDHSNPTPSQEDLLPTSTGAIGAAPTPL